MRAQRDDPVGRLEGPRERCARQIADVLVAIELNPGPALALVVDRDALAVERFGLERGVRAGVTPERRACGENPLRLPDRVSGRVDETAQMIRREVGAGGVSRRSNGTAGMGPEVGLSAILRRCGLAKG